MLMIDVGNSRIKYALLADNDWQLFRSYTYQQKDIDHQFDDIFHDIPCQSVYVACVVDAMRKPLSHWFHTRCLLTPSFVDTEEQLAGVTNAYEKPETLGVDRWLAMVAAYNKFRLPVCVIDCGTAVTVDVVDANGLHQGGLIIPGLQLMRAALFDKASRINSARGNRVELAKNTEDAVESGCEQLLVSGLDQICRKQQSKYSALQIVVTGGDGELVARKMQSNVVFSEMLVMDGLRIAATGNY